MTRYLSSLLKADRLLSRVGQRMRLPKADRHADFATCVGHVDNLDLIAAWQVSRSMISDGRGYMAMLR
ncbi:MAG: hypothetical protein ACO1RT_18815 [Planctomycetaceae bacterium]